MDAMPMIATCATRQAIPYVVLNACHCGAEKSRSYWQCPTCQLKDEIRIVESRKW